MRNKSDAVENLQDIETIRCMKDLKAALIQYRSNYIVQLHIVLDEIHNEKLASKSSALIMRSDIHKA